MTLATIIGIALGIALLVSGSSRFSNALVTASATFEASVPNSSREVPAANSLSSPHPARSNTPSLKFFQEYIDRGAYCSHPDTLYSNCLFHNACVSVENGSDWYVEGLPPRAAGVQWRGVLMRSRKGLWRDRPSLAGCNQPWRPNLKSADLLRQSRNPDSSHSAVNSTLGEGNVSFLNGTWYYLCSFYPRHFGHTLMEVTIPTGRALEALSDRFPSLFPLSSDEDAPTWEGARGAFTGGVRLVASNGGEEGVNEVSNRFLSTITFGSAHPQVEELSSILKKAKNEGMTHVCFEHLGVGFRAQGSLEFAMNTWDVESSHLDRFRRRVRRRFAGVALPQDCQWPMNCSCRILMEGRPDRLYADTPGFIDFVAQRTGCCVQMWTLFNLTHAQQIRAVLDVDVYICPLGSGCHHFLWMKPKGVLIVITGWVLQVGGEGRIGGGGHVLNDWLCYHLRRDLLCLTVPSNNTHVRGKHEKVTWLAKSGTVQVDYDAFQNALEWVQLHSGVGRGVWDPVRPE
jgi:hypothetical protein